MARDDDPERSRPRSVSDRIVDTIEDPEKRARFLRWAWWISVAFVLFGYVIIFLTIRG